MHILKVGCRVGDYALEIIALYLKALLNLVVKYFKVGKRKVSLSEGLGIGVDHVHRTLKSVEHQLGVCDAGQNLPIGLLAKEVHRDEIGGHDDKHETNEDTLRDLPALGEKDEVRKVLFLFDALR